MRWLAAAIGLVPLLAGCGGLPQAADQDQAQNPAAATFSVLDVGTKGGEPTVAIARDGCIFYQSWAVLRTSCDHGQTWTTIEHPLLTNVNSDPYLWLDRTTGRLFDVQQGPIFPPDDALYAWISWSDDGGMTWYANPVNSGPLPDIYHNKLGTGPWTEAGYGLLGRVTGTVYASAVYLCYGSQLGLQCATSTDGGATFRLGSPAPVAGVTDPEAVPGAITAAPDGTIYVPPRTAVPSVAVSRDNGFTWSLAQFGRDVGTPDRHKDAEVAADTASNAYVAWIGGDQRVYLSRTLDKGATWDAGSIPVSPPNVLSATFAQIQAGDPGRIAVAYLGSQDSATNPHDADDGARWDLYVSLSLDALGPSPTFHTFRVTDNPVQMGAICQLSSACKDGSRNLLDFNDLSLDVDGRLYIAFTDGCTDGCAATPSPTAQDSRDNQSMLAVLSTGPSLFLAAGNLTATT